MSAVRLWWVLAPRLRDIGSYFGRMMVAYGATHLPLMGDGGPNAHAELLRIISGRPRQPRGLPSGHPERLCRSTARTGSERELRGIVFGPARVSGRWSGEPARPSRQQDRSS
jgi:Family of unknown function (DUF6059)